MKIIITPKTGEAPKCIHVPLSILCNGLTAAIVYKLLSGKLSKAEAEAAKKELEAGIMTAENTEDTDDVEATEDIDDMLSKLEDDSAEDNDAGIDSATATGKLEFSGISRKALSAILRELRRMSRIHRGMKLVEVVSDDETVEIIL